MTDDIEEDALTDDQVAMLLEARKALNEVAASSLRNSGELESRVKNLVTVTEKFANDFTQYQVVNVVKSVYADHSSYFHGALTDDRMNVLGDGPASNLAEVLMAAYYFEKAESLSEFSEAFETYETMLEYVETYLED